MEELVERAKNEDSEAFTNLILNIERDLYCIARSKINNENDIDDIIQETMIIAFLNIKKLKNNSFFKTWVIRILINNCNKFYKRKKHKSIDEDEVIWNIGFESGTMEINSKGEFESLNIPSYNYKIPYNYGITREEARKTAKELLAKYNPNNNNNEYELVSLKRNAEEDEDAYIWYAEFYKKYDGLLNKHEKVSIGWIPKINGLYSLIFENYKYENNEQKISKEDAIRIATEKDKQIETRHNIVSTDAELGIDKMNTEVVYREKNIEEYEKGTINFTPGENGTPKIKDDAVFYKVDNRVRKVWEVSIYYDYYKYTKDFPERFVYYVDATTGEIIGGDRFYGAKMQLKNLMDDPYKE